MLTLDIAKKEKLRSAFPLDSTLTKQNNVISLQQEKLDPLLHLAEGPELLFYAPAGRFSCATSK